MRVIDVGEWSTIRAEEMGRDERKVWIAADPGADRDNWWLWKPCLPTGDGTHLRLNDVAEAITHELAELIGVPTAQCRLATRDGLQGVISKNVSPPTVELVHGGSMIAGTYGLASIASALATASPPPLCAGMAAFQVFTGFLVLDAWVANTDRHGENWALLQPADGPLTLAPAFDHGSALGSGLTDQNRMSRDVRTFCRKGRTRHFIEGGSLLSLADEAIQASDATWWAEQVRAVPREAWRDRLAGIEGLSDAACTFVDGILTYNQERVKTLCRR